LGGIDSPFADPRYRHLRSPSVPGSKHIVSAPGGIYKNFEERRKTKKLILSTFAPLWDTPLTHREVENAKLRI
jgi:hypothetical protein